jgi:4-aminobutyrate aminotransferase
MPLAALIAREGLNVGQHISLGHYTHEKNPLACAAGLAVLDVIEQEDLLARSRRLGEAAVKHLHTGLAHLPVVKEVRGAGLLIGIELTDADLAEAVLYHCLTAGLSFKVGQGQVLVLAPPLNVDEADLFWALDCVIRAIQALAPLAATV